MNDLHIEDTTSVIIDGNIQIVGNLGEMFEVLNIPNTEEYYEARCNIIAQLLAWHELDLSPAYPGHSVKVSVEFHIHNENF